MAFDPWAIRPKTQKRVHTRTFTDLESGAEFTLTLRRLSSPEGCLAYERGQKLVEQFITGNEEEGTRAEDFPPIAAGEVEATLSETLLISAAVIERMQPENAVERYSALDIVAMNHTLSKPTLAQISKFVKEVSSGGSDALGNALSGVAAASSSPPSPPSEDIQSSTQEPTTS